MGANSLSALWRSKNLPGLGKPMAAGANAAVGKARSKLLSRGMTGLMLLFGADQALNLYDRMRGKSPEQLEFLLKKAAMAAELEDAPERRNQDRLAKLAMLNELEKERADRRKITGIGLQAEAESVPASMFQEGMAMREAITDKTDMKVAAINAALRSEQKVNPLAILGLM